MKSAIFPRIFAVAALALSLLAEATYSQTFSVVYSFTNSPQPGDATSSLILDNDTLYGITYNGGTSSNGTVFKVKTNGSGYTVIKNFSALSDSYPYTNSDGAWPSAALVLSGNTLYGTTQNGGSLGGGTVFKVDTDGARYTNLKNFPRPDLNNHNYDGAFPCAGLVKSGSTLYGTARYGGTNGTGTIFKVDTNGGSFAVLKTFSGNINDFSSPSDGALPSAALVLSSNTLYGTTYFGGNFGNGTVFMINTNGSGYSLLKSFPDRVNGANHDGAKPWAGLALNGSTLYGTTTAGGESGWGTVFKISTHGDDFTVLRAFANIPDGAYPQSVLLLDGNTLYGTTAAGGSSGNGTVFKISTDGIGFAIAKCFSATIGGINTDGANPNFAGLVLSGSTFYGATSSGGNSGSGTVFKLDLAPQLGAVVFSNSIPQVTITNFLGQSVDIQAATNLTGPWELLTNLVLTNGIGQCSDPFGTNLASQRFYRAVAQ